MYCLTRYEMKFGNYLIPARTKAKVVNEPQYREANIPGLQLNININLMDIAFMTKKSVHLDEVEINNKLGGSNSKMVGISISTNGKEVFMDAGDDFYDTATLYEFQIKKVLGTEVIPEKIKKLQYADRKYSLKNLLEYIENEFTNWVVKNCEFYALDEDDIENGDCIDGAEAGDTTLSAKGIEQFNKKQLEYKNRLETIGFTYEFKGGLVWE